MAFFADDGDSCQDDPSQGISLTTGTIPYDYTCFNLSGIFSQSLDSGHQNASDNLHGEGTLSSDGEGNGISWWLHNQGSFDSNANYSGVWYEQVNLTGEIKAGEDARWAFYIYPLDDCEQIALGADQDDLYKYPWFETSCQTEKGGQCQTVPYSIRSFAIANSQLYYEDLGPCDEWALLGETTRRKVPVLLAALVTMTVVLFA